MSCFCLLMKRETQSGIWRFTSDWCCTVSFLFDLFKHFPWLASTTTSASKPSKKPFVHVLHLLQFIAGLLYFSIFFFVTFFLCILPIIYKTNLGPSRSSSNPPQKELVCLFLMLSHIVCVFVAFVFVVASFGLFTAFVCLFVAFFVFVCLLVYFIVHSLLNSLFDVFKHFPWFRHQQ